MERSIPSWRTNWTGGAQRRPDFIGGGAEGMVHGWRRRALRKRRCLREQTKKTYPWNTPISLLRFCPLSSRTMGKLVICSSQIPSSPRGFAVPRRELTRPINRSSPSLRTQELRGILLLPSIDGFSSSPSAVHLFPAPLSSCQVISRHSEFAAAYFNFFSA